MTNKEAASLLGWLKSKTNREDDLEAIDMAIDALSVDGDLISRQDAIEAVRKEYEDAINIGDNGDAIAYDIERILSALPSAEAEPTVIRSRTFMPTKDFKEWAKRIREVNPNAVVIPCDAEVVSAEAVQGEWSATKNDVCGIDTCGAEQRR